MPSVLKSRPVAACALVLGCAYVAAVLSVHLSTFPNLHADEAWEGLFALRIRVSGLYTPHGTNTYTGPWYAWMIAQVFTRTAPGVSALRTIGVAANACAVALLTWHHWRRCGPARAFAWLSVVAATPMFLVTSRVAWEVYALQDVCIAVLVVLLWGFVEEQRYTAWRVWLFAAVMQAGVMSHGIFASVPLSLAVCVAVLLIRRPDSPLAPLFRLTCVCLAASAIALATGMAMSPEGWQRYRTACAAGGALLPIAAVAVFKATSGEDIRIRDWCGRLAASAAARRTLGGLLAAGLLAFAVLDLVGLVQVLSGVAIFERVVSWLPPVWLRLPLYAAAAGALGVALGRAAASTRVTSGFSKSDRVLTLWPVALMAIFVLVRPVAAIRHFSILIFLLMVALTAALPSLVARRRAFIVVGGALVLVLHVCLWREILVPHVRRPIDFHVGWMGGGDVEAFSEPRDPAADHGSRRHLPAARQRLLSERAARVRSRRASSGVPVLAGARGGRLRRLRRRAVCPVEAALVWESACSTRSPTSSRGRSRRSSPWRCSCTRRACRWWPGAGRSCWPP